jgi:hypothetical protein
LLILAWWFVVIGLALASIHFYLAVEGEPYTLLQHVIRLGAASVFVSAAMKIYRCHRSYCRGLRMLGWVGVVYGALMIALALLEAPGDPPASWLGYEFPEDGWTIGVAVLVISLPTVCILMLPSVREAIRRPRLQWEHPEG